MKVRTAVLDEVVEEPRQFRVELVPARGERRPGRRPVVERTVGLGCAGCGPIEEREIVGGRGETHIVPTQATDNPAAIGPDLTDTKWMHGGKPMEIFDTVTKGVLVKGMPAWGNAIADKEIRAMVIFIREQRDLFRRGQLQFNKLWKLVMHCSFLTRKISSEKVGKLWKGTRNSRIRSNLQLRKTFLAFIGIQPMMQRSWHLSMGSTTPS